jgi:hypothetical protein
VPSPNGFTIADGGGGTNNAAVTINATAGTPFTGVVGSFTDLDPNANAKDYTAVINWGDGHQTNGSIVPDPVGGFDVMGTNTYAASGKFAVAVDVADFGGGPGIGGTAPTQSITNTANVVGVPVVTTAQPATTGFSNAQQTVIVSANLTVPSNPATMVNEGTVTFQVLRNTTVLASAQGTVSNNVAQGVVTLPAGLASGTYTLGVSYGDPGGMFADGGDVGSTLTITLPTTTTTTTPPVVTVTTKIVASFSTSNSFFSVTVQATASDGSPIGPGLSLPFLFFPFPVVGSVMQDSSGTFDVHLNGLFFGLFPFPLDVFFDSSGKLTSFKLG